MAIPNSLYLHWLEFSSGMAPRKIVVSWPGRSGGNDISPPDGAPSASGLRLVTRSGVVSRAATDVPEPVRPLLKLLPGSRPLTGSPEARR